MSRGARTVLRLALIALIAAGGGAACTNGTERSSKPSEAATGDSTTKPTVTSTETRPAVTTPFARPRPISAPYEPPAKEPYVNGKRLAGRVAQELATFGPGASATELASRVDAAGERPAELERIVVPLLNPARRSTGEVVYVQLSGVTATTLGTMVLVRQRLENAEGNTELVVRVMDVRLRRTDGPWSLDRVASVGGTAVPRPANVSSAAARVLDHPGIWLPDTARWDIYRGLVDEGLLQALGDAADQSPFAVTVLRTGHPPNVWATRRPSAHAAGRAADIYAVDSTLVLRQRTNGSSAHQLAAAFLAAGARQVGSPWILPPGGKRSFTDRAHQDHVHVQRTPTPQPRR